MKTGGLADAVTALATALSAAGHDVRVLLPRYFFIERGLLKLQRGMVAIRTGYGIKQTNFYGATIPGSAVQVLLPEYRDLFAHRHIYGDVYEPLGKDNGQRYGFLCRVAAEPKTTKGWRPDIVHCHDWPTAPTAALIAGDSSGRGGPIAGGRGGPATGGRGGLATGGRGGLATGGIIASGANRRPRPATVLTIHNCGYQGIFDLQQSQMLGLSVADFQRMGWIADGRINFLRAGIRNADMITAVSPRYAREILSPEFSGALAADLVERRQQLVGILNGIDYDTWNPSNDEYLPVTYDVDSLQNKRQIKSALQQAAGLERRDDVPLCVMVTRLVEQKGMTELCDADGLERMARDLPIQLAILGVGKPHYERKLADIACRYRNVAFWNRFTERDAHLLEAAGDFFLMPSRYEPCGLNQSYSLRYGTVPIVAATGGLLDTIVSCETDPETGYGFFIERQTPELIYQAVARAAKHWRRPGWMAELQQRGMRKRFSWTKAADQYTEVYHRAVAVQRG